MSILHDTIVAQATALGEGAVAIVRLSGTDAYAIADRFVMLSSHVSVASVPSRYLTGAMIGADIGPIDQCLLVRFQAPRSFTGEDVVELHVHGNPLIVDTIIRMSVEAGARVADPGEFTRRAFLNGKMDLTQAEALADVIRAESDQALVMAQRQMMGEMRSRLEEFRGRVIDLLARMELELDFVEDGYHFSSPEELVFLIDELRQFAGELVAAHRSADRLRRGPRILLYGRPNAGKSSLFNAFLGYSRALVSPVAGTTRDYLEEKIFYAGITLHFLDSAGIRSTEDSIEAEGVRRSNDLVEIVDHVLYLADSSDPAVASYGPVEFEQLTEEFPAVGWSFVWTKSDIGSLDSTVEQQEIRCSIQDTDSIHALLGGLASNFSMDKTESLVAFSRRQIALLGEILRIVEGVRVAGATTEMISVDLRALLDPLSQLTGAATSEDVLNAVFSSFCIGK